MSWRGAPLRRPTRRQAAATPASLGVALLLGTAQDVAAAAPPTGGDHPPGELLAAAALGRAVRKVTRPPRSPRPLSDGSVNQDPTAREREPMRPLLSSSSVIYCLAGSSGVLEAQCPM